jgi:hypothetical protein
MGIRQWRTSLLYFRFLCNMRCIFFFVFLLVAASESSWSQTTFGKKIHVGYSCWSNACTQIKDGKYVLACTYYEDRDSAETSANPCLFQVDENFTSGLVRIINKNLWGEALSVCPTFDGGFAMTGWGHTSQTSGLFLSKYGSSGEQGVFLGIQDNSSGNSIIQTKDSGFAIAGSRIPATGIPESFIVKVSKNDSLEWATGFKTDSNGYGGTPSTIIQTKDGEYVAAGYGISHSKGGFELTKISATGIIRWKHIITVTQNIIEYGMTASDDGGFAVCGQTDDFKTGNENIYVGKFDEKGNLSWGVAINPFRHGVAKSIIRSYNGGYIITGGLTSSIAPPTNNDKFTDSLFVAEIDRDGNPLLLKFLALPNTSSEGESIIQTSDGGYIVSGSIIQKGESKSILVLKLDKDLNSCNMQSSLVTSLRGGQLLDTDFFSTFGSAIHTALTKSSLLSFSVVETCSEDVKEPTPYIFIPLSLSLSPNPLHSSELLTIHTDNLPQGTYDLHISDLLGNILIKEKINLEREKDIPIDVFHLPSGMSIVEMRKGSNVYRAKLVKVK